MQKGFANYKFNFFTNEQGNLTGNEATYISHEIAFF
jgi:hypothetical protein